MCLWTATEMTIPVYLVWDTEIEISRLENKISSFEYKIEMGKEEFRVAMDIIDPPYTMRRCSFMMKNDIFCHQVKILE